jgi:hypothetical protein
MHLGNGHPWPGMKHYLIVVLGQMHHKWRFGFSWQAVLDEGMAIARMAVVASHLSLLERDLKLTEVLGHDGIINRCE